MKNILTKVEFNISISKQGKRDNKVKLYNNKKDNNENKKNKKIKMEVITYIDPVFKPGRQVRMASKAKYNHLKLL